MTQAALLLLPDGGVKLITERARVSDIMKEHPGFAVGSFTSNREVLPAEKLLRSGSSYYLHRVTNSNGSSDNGNADDGSDSGFPRTRSYASAPSIRGDTPSPEHPSLDSHQASQSHTPRDNFRDFAGSLNFVRSSTMSRRASLAIDTSTRGVSDASVTRDHQRRRLPRQRCKQEQQNLPYDARSPKSPGAPRSPRLIGATTPSLSPSSSISPSPRQLSPHGTTSEQSPRYQDFAAWSSSTASSSNGDLPRVHSETTLRSYTYSSNHPSREAANVGDSAVTSAAPVCQSGVQGRILKWKIRDDTTAIAKGGRLSTCAEDIMATRLLLVGSYGNNSRASISGVPPLHMRNGF